MYDECKKIFWGIFITTFHIKLGVIKILPAFIGFMLITSAVASLYRKTNIESFNKAKIYGIIVIISVGLGEFIELISIDITQFFLLSEVWIVPNTVIEILMFFKYFEGIIEYFNMNNQENLVAKGIGNVRAYIIASIINVILLNFAIVFNIISLQFVVALVLIIIRVSLMVITNGFKKVVPE